MGYPMTYRRVLHRNGIEVGTIGDGHRLVPSLATGSFPPRDRFNADVDYDHLCREEISRLQGQLLEAATKFGQILGDLRRLEHDTVDEGLTCAKIAERTGVDAEIVAAVLKEFITW